MMPSSSDSFTQSTMVPAMAFGAFVLFTAALTFLL
jgi:hypothetical protein